MKEVAIIGYSGHAYVAIELLRVTGLVVGGYCEREEKEYNPYQLRYLGSEQNEALSQLEKMAGYFVAVGNNRLRHQIYSYLTQHLPPPLTAIHPRAIIAETVQLAAGVMVGAGAVVQALAVLGEGVICNTAAVVEHECQVGPFCHIAPGAVLCGNVTVGNFTHIGANSVVRQGVRIGQGVVIGAGTVVVKDVPDGAIVVGNPSRNL